MLPRQHCSRTPPVLEPGGGLPSGRMASFGGSGVRLFKRPLLAIAAFAVSGAIGVAATYGVYRAETARVQAAFARDLMEVSAFVERRVAQDVAFLTATRAYLRAQPGGLTRAQFRAFVDGLGLRGPSDGLQGVGLARIVDAGAGGTAGVAASLLRDYGVDRGVWPESDLALRTAIALLEPEDARNRAALGYDMYTEPVRRAAMDRARAGGGAVATGPVRLVQEIDATPQTGLLIFLYFPPEAATAQSPARGGGFVYSPIRLGELFTAAMAGTGGSFDLRAVDLERPDQPLFEGADFAGLGGRGGLAATTALRIAGRDWEVSARARAEGSVVRRYPFTVVTAVTALLAALSIGLAVQGLGAAVRRARALNEAQAALMREKDLHLREMSHRLKNALARVVAMARQAARTAETKEEFVAAMTGRLQAMAEAQDMLTRTGGSAGLRALLKAELAQIYGEGAVGGAVPGAELSGPEVRLDPQQTQALGLTFHELATNSLKYGAGAVPGAVLAIRWRFHGRGAKRELVLDWVEETGQPATAPERKGFGTQLVETCIRLDLGGTVERSYGPTGFAVQLRVPFATTPKAGALPAGAALADGPAAAADQ